MRIRLGIKLLPIALLFSVAAYAQNQSEAYLAYIDQYYPLAVQQQKEHGIPASITLAQGLLESSAGLSEFARRSNNHFGIKCSDWNGEKIYHDDDEKGECFRKYEHVVESYEDHSLFLKTRKRYSFLFDYAPTDYQSWAHGLKKAGYATDPAYATKLIKLIEDYDLHRFDLGKAAVVANNRIESAPETKALASVGGSYRVSRAPMGAVVALVSHEVRKVNGVKFVTALPEDTYKSISDEFNMSVERLLAYNDLAFETSLIPGTRVFIGRKKNKAPKECLAHRVMPGETMRSISQDYGVKVLNLYKLNKMPLDQWAGVGQVLKLR